MSAGDFSPNIQRTINLLQTLRGLNRNDGKSAESTQFWATSGKFIAGARCRGGIRIRIGPSHRMGADE